MGEDKRKGTRMDEDIYETLVQIAKKEGKMIGRVIDEAGKLYIINYKSRKLLDERVNTIINKL